MPLSLAKICCYTLIVIKYSTLLLFSGTSYIQSNICIGMHHAQKRSVPKKLFLDWRWGGGKGRWGGLRGGEEGRGKGGK